MADFVVFSFLYTYAFNKLRIHLTEEITKSFPLIEMYFNNMKNIFVDYYEYKTDYLF